MCRFNGVVVAGEEFLSFYIPSDISGAIGDRLRPVIVALCDLSGPNI